VQISGLSAKYSLKFLQTAAKKDKFAQMNQKLSGRGGFVAENCGETADIDLLPMYFGGDCYYVRKLELPEEVGGIALCDASRDNTNWVECIGAGPSVGTNKRVDVAEAGDFLLCPDFDEGIKRSQLCDWEFVVKADLPYAVVKKEDWAEAFSALQT